MLRNHIIDKIVNKVGLQLKNWLSIQQDHAQTNKSCLRLITEDYPDAQSTKKYCCTHGLINNEKQILGKGGSAKYTEQFRNQWQKVIQYPGKARDRTELILTRYL